MITYNRGSTKQFDAGVPITRLSKLLGHASVEMTQRYLNLELDLEVTASDFVPL